MFLFRAGPCGIAEHPTLFGLVRAVRRPKRNAVGPQHLFPHARHRHGVRHDHDRGLQPFRAVHRHHADLVAVALFKVALDLGRAGVEPVQEPLKRRRMRPLESERLRHEFIDRVFRVRAKPFQQTLPA